MKLVLAILLVASFTPAFSQKGIPGYVVKSPNDTLRGFIRDRLDWSKPYIEFSSTENADATKLTYDQVEMFYLKTYDSYYYIETVDIDKKPREVINLETFPGRKIVRENIPLHLLVRGTINLYGYTDELGKQHYFVQKNNDKIQELDFVKYKNGLRLVEMPFYLETLKAMMSDCDKVNTDGLRYETNTFVKTVRKYNSCFASTADYEASGSGLKVGLGISVGAGSSSVKFSGAGAPSDFSKSSSFFAGLHLDLSSDHEGVWFVPGFDMMYQKVGDMTASTSNNISRTQLTTNYSLLNTGVNGKFIVTPKLPVKVYAKLAVSLAFALDTKAEYVTKDIFTDKVTTGDFAFPKKMGFSFSGGVGVSYKNFFLESNYLNNSVATEKEPKPMIRTFNILIGYRFLNK